MKALRGRAPGRLAASIVFVGASALAACGGATTPSPGGDATQAPADGAPGEYPASQPSPDAAEGASASRAEAEAACLRTARTPWDSPGDPSDTARARHLLVTFGGAKRSKPEVTRTEGEACLRAMEARDKLRGGADFAEIAAAYSDEPGAASRGGSLGEFKRSMMVKAFSDAVFALEPGQLSDVVQTDFGFHVILREP